MNTYETAIIILMVLNLLLGIDAWWLAKQCNKADEKVKNLEKELAKDRFVMPVAEIKTQFSEEDMKKIKELLNNMKPGDVKLGEPDERKCEYDHFYDSVMLENDPKYCREKLIFRCGSCGHEEIIPISQGLLVDLIRKGGRV
jgi:hypothetical protein